MRALIIAAGLLISTVSFGQTQPSSANLDNPKASFVAIIVANIDSSIKWYQSTFGMTLKNRTVLPEKNAKQANLERSRWQVELIELDGAVSRDKVEKKFENKPIQGISKFGIRVREFDAWISFLTAKKVEFVGSVVNDDKGKKMILVKDPDGNVIQVFEE